MPHVLIIGAGLTGAALAFRLTRLGASVTVVEAQGPAAGASGRSFGWVNASFFLSPAHFNLRAAGIEAHARLSRDLGTPPPDQGCLWWEEDLESHARTLQDMGYRVEYLIGHEARARVPSLAAPEACLHFPTEGAVDCADLTSWLLRASGAKLITGTPVKGIEVRSGRVAGGRIAQGVIAADHVVIAAGCGAPALLAPLGLTLPLLDRPGAILRTAPVAARIGPIIASPGQEVRQDTDGSLLAPLSAHHQSDTSEAITESPEAMASACLARLAGLFPGLPLEVREIALARRPVPGDGLPALGPQGPEGLWTAVMHSGATLAPVVAELLSSEILGGPEAALLAPFRPGRFAA